ncbi:MAG: hypothetical protein NTV94_14135 [Planctomycetota bacterium]|nr:hypothetical protein [Planctomycetota bacterium]
MTMHILRPICLSAALLASSSTVLVGCSSMKATPDVAVGAGSYAAAFDAARETLRAHGFELERVDSAAGVITSAPKSSAGLATPWDRDQTTLMQEADDLLNHQKRRVRITFTHEQSGGVPIEDQAVHAAVAVYIERVQSPGMRIPAKSPTTWTTTQDPARTQQGVGTAYSIPVTRDTKFERRLAAEIEKRLASANSQPLAAAKP